MAHTYKLVNGQEIPLTSSEIAYFDGNDAAFSAGESARIEKQIRAEAERRKDAGFVLSSGVRFRCDDSSIARISGLKDAPVSVFPTKFRTSAGVSVTVNNNAEAQTVFDEAATFVADVLDASATLQENPPADYEDDSHWPLAVHPIKTALNSERR